MDIGDPDFPTYTTNGSMVSVWRALRTMHGFKLSPNRDPLCVSKLLWEVVVFKSCVRDGVWWCAIERFAYIRTVC
jgi:hypothetical protein